MQTPWSTNILLYYCVIIQRLMLILVTWYSIFSCQCAYFTAQNSESYLLKTHQLDQPTFLLCYCVIIQRLMLIFVTWYSLFSCQYAYFSAQSKGSYLLKTRQLQGSFASRPPVQGLCPWTPLGGSAPRTPLQVRTPRSPWIYDPGYTNLTNRSLLATRR